MSAHYRPESRAVAHHAVKLRPILEMELWKSDRSMSWRREHDTVLEIKEEL
jgi:hypothetical protein